MYRTGAKHDPEYPGLCESGAMRLYPAAIGPGAPEGDAHIVGYYAPAGGGQSERGLRASGRGRAQKGLGLPLSWPRPANANLCPVPCGSALSAPRSRARSYSHSRSSSSLESPSGISGRSISRSSMAWRSSPSILSSCSSRGPYGANRSSNLW
jgi:hypothetical protein